MTTAQEFGEAIVLAVRSSYTDSGETNEEIERLIEVFGEWAAKGQAGCRVLGDVADALEAAVKSPA